MTSQYDIVYLSYTCLAGTDPANASNYVNFVRDLDSIPIATQTNGAEFPVRKLKVTSSGAWSQTDHQADVFIVFRDLHDEYKGYTMTTYVFYNNSSNSVFYVQKDDIVLIFNDQYKVQSLKLVRRNMLLFTEVLIDTDTTFGADEPHYASGTALFSQGTAPWPQLFNMFASV